MMALREVCGKERRWFRAGRSDKGNQVGKGFDSVCTVPLHAVKGQSAGRGDSLVRGGVAGEEGLRHVNIRVFAARRMNQAGAGLAAGAARVPSVRTEKHVQNIDAFLFQKNEELFGVFVIEGLSDLPFADGILIGDDDELIPFRAQMAEAFGCAGQKDGLGGAFPVLGAARVFAGPEAFVNGSVAVQKCNLQADPSRLIV